MIDVWFEKNSKRCKGGKYDVGKFEKWGRGARFLFFFSCSVSVSPEEEEEEVEKVKGQFPARFSDKTHSGAMREKKRGDFITDPLGNSS